MDAASRLLTTRVTRLEMASAPVHRVAMPLGHRLALMRAKDIPLHFYRYLYEQVGKPHHWLMRRNLADDALAAEIHAATCEIELIYAEGAPAGFYELDLSRLPGEAEIRYFGLIPDFQGRGLSRFFLSSAIFAAWAHLPGKVVIHTNTLDSPRALQLYQKLGFTAVGWSEETVVPWT